MGLGLGLGVGVGVRVRCVRGREPTLSESLPSTRPLRSGSHSADCTSLIVAWVPTVGAFTVTVTIRVKVRGRIRVSVRVTVRVRVRARVRVSVRVTFTVTTQPGRKKSSDCRIRASSPVSFGMHAREPV